MSDTAATDPRNTLLPSECPNCGRLHKGHDFTAKPGPVQTHLSEALDRVAALETERDATLLAIPHHGCPVCRGAERGPGGALCAHCGGSGEDPSLASLVESNLRHLERKREAADREAADMMKTTLEGIAEDAEDEDYGRIEKHAREALSVYAALPECGRHEDYAMMDGSWICHACGHVEFPAGLGEKP